MILISNDQDKMHCPQELLDFCEAILQESLRFLDVPPEAEVSVVFIDDEAIRALNREYRQKDCATDVLSFAQQEGEEIIDGSGELLLGDIIVSLERAAEQAASFGHSLRREIAFLLVHGLLHLLGYDHDDEFSGEMRQQQEAIMAHLGDRV